MRRLLPWKRDAVSRSRSPTTQRILADLIADGYVTRTKVGRRNNYEINARGHLRHPVFRDLSIGPLIEVLNANGQPKLRQGLRRQ